MIFESPDAFTPSAGAFGEDTGSPTAGAVTLSGVVLGVSVIGSSQALGVSAASNSISLYRTVGAEGSGRTNGASFKAH